MSARGKTRLHELPESSPKSSGSGPKKARPSVNSGEKSGSVVEVGSLEPFLEKMVKNAMAEVMETWKDELTTHILTSLEAIHSRFETRLQDLEKRRVSDHAVIDQQGGVENVQYATNHKRKFFFLWLVAYCTFSTPPFMVGCVLYVFNAPLINQGVVKKKERGDATAAQSRAMSVSARARGQLEPSHAYAHYAH